MTVHEGGADFENWGVTNQIYFGKKKKEKKRKCTLLVLEKEKKK